MSVDRFPQFEETCRATQDPGFYPPLVTFLESREIHIAIVFLTGDWVNKLKKPVDFGSLDSRKLEARRSFCELEVHLNQRLSKGIYEGVAEIRRDEMEHLSLGGTGDVVECAVKMRQLPDAASLRALIERQKVSRTDIENLGHQLAA